MPRSLGNLIADSLDRGVSYGEVLLEGVEADRFARFASPGGEPVVSNHAAFVYGHLSLYAPKIIGDLGGSAPAVPEGFEAVFSREATCQDDVDGTIYPAMEEVTRYFFESYRQASEVLRATDNAPFEQANPVGGKFTEMFPTIGSAHAFYGSGHIMLHLGQMSAWRRMSGLGAC